VGVFDWTELVVRADEAEGDFEELDVLVDVIVLVVVLVVVVEGLTKEVGLALRVRVVVLVDVFDCVEVEVSITPLKRRFLCPPTAGSLGWAEGKGWAST
jgi:hypothetical protein